MNAELGPVEVYDLRPIREIVFQKLREAIIDGRIKKGEHLVESIVATKMSVSRTPVREALRQLEIEGLILNIPRKGAIVQGITKEDALDIYDLREVLEGLMARLACRNITEADINRLKGIIELMEEAINNENYDEFLVLHGEYNTIILNSSKNKRLQSTLKNLYEYLTGLRSISLFTKDRRMVALEEHKEIVYALEKKDEDHVETLTRMHIRKAKKAFLSNLE
ncbi:transcriptional regulator, GntR family [Anaerovirgula multivorans]|uniref:Transcriptional regulator, GntR family n=1 Tax=Anaerovirgula multivorans TaxID=312168 RepID=A0A239KB00_9FIRM|nr:GntR family transcriptional regulator [Anaerovirgula multivorans]SNT14284.1 transcriptional regulator, GntR family [Anaerovirgula multivorans]